MSLGPGSAAAADTSSARGRPHATAAAAVEARVLVVPLLKPGLQHLCVEYPGYVEDEEKVLETLGGLDDIARQLQDNPKTLALRLRPADCNCHPNFAAREGCKRLLVKLTRSSPATNSGGAIGSIGSGRAGGWSAEVVAALPYTYRWTSPADYQYVAFDSRPIEGQGLEQREGANPPGFQQQPLLCAPPLFAKQPQFDYAFRGYISAAAPRGSTAATAAATSSKKKGGMGIMASFFDLELPQPLPEAALAAAAHHHVELLCTLRALLQRCPIWPAAALHEAVASAGGSAAAASRSLLDELLPKLCYKFRNGPWKNTWTRRGFDPRATTAARCWQCIEYHLPSEWYAKIAEHKKAAALQKCQQQEQHEQQQQAVADATQQQQQQEMEKEGTGMEKGEQLPPLAATYCQLQRFEAVPNTQSCSLQLAGVGDSVVQQLLKDPANHTQHCTDNSGWLVSAAIESIKRRVKERFQAVLDGVPIADADAAMQKGDRMPQRMQMDGGAGGGELSAGRGAAGAGAAAAMDTDEAELAQQTQQHLSIQPQPPAAQKQQQQQHALQGAPGAAVATAAAAAARGRGEALQLLPTGLMEELQAFLAHLPGQDEGDEGEEEEEEEGEEEEEEGADYQSDEGYQTEEGAGGAQSEDE